MSKDTEEAVREQPEYMDKVFRIISVLENRLPQLEKKRAHIKREIHQTESEMAELKNSIASLSRLSDMDEVFSGGEFSNTLIGHHPELAAVDILASAFAEIPGDPHETEPRGAEILEHAGHHVLAAN